MTADAFYWVLNMSLIGGLTGVIVLLIGKIPRLPRFAAYALWLLPLIRLWIPFGIANRYSLINLLSSFATKTVTPWQSFPQITLTNSVQAAESYFPVVYKTPLLGKLFAAAALVWATVAAALLFSALILYALTKRELKDAAHLRDNIYSSDKITAPAVYGILCPKIIVPAWLSEDKLGYVLAHERVHIRRIDNLWRVAAIVSACVHWFNPLTWIFLRCFFADMELACDAKVLRILGEDKAKDYAAALLSCAAGKSYFTSAFGGAKTRVRIENILSYRRLTLFSTIAVAAFLSLMGIVLITNAVGG